MRLDLSTIVIATANPHKVRELRSIFEECGLQRVRFIGLHEVTVRVHEPIEDRTSFEGNSSAKALDYAQQIGLPCLADDSGLEVDALGGKPGVISSHYCTDGRDEGMTREQRDALNNERVLRELAGVPPELRTARFVCCMTLALPNPPGHLIQGLTRGTFEGRIGTPPHVPRGSHGFGYDPLFLVAPNFTKTSAELDPAEKNRLSHRAHAAKAMAQEIAQLLRGRPI